MAPKLYDCFPFYNELDLLEVRLNELSGVVDRFVIVEAGETFNGKPKPFVLEENFQRFAAFADRITHLKIASFPPGNDRWFREHLQRDKLIEGLADAGPDDLVMISDLDEIPDPKVLAAIKRDPPRGARVLCLELRYFHFFLNLERRERWLKYGPRLMRRGALPNIHELKRIRGPVKGTLRNFVRGLRASWGMKRWITRQVIRDAGWHFTWLGGLDAVVSKAGAIPFHSSLPRGLEQAGPAQKLIDDALASVGTACDIVPIDDSFPRYIQQHREALSRHILPLPQDGNGTRG